VTKFTALKDLGEFPLVLLLKVGWKHGKELGSEECKMMGNGLLGVCGRGKKLSIGAEF
jgi:hypothetical protein